MTQPAAEQQPGQPPAPTPAAPPATPPPPTQPAAGDPPGTEALGDPGKKALDTMKAERNAARDEAKKKAEELAALKAMVEGKEAEHKAEQERRAAEQAALAKANERILKAEIRVAAAGKLADPADALRYLDLSSFDVGDDGEVDAAKIATAIDELIKTKPYLAAQGGKRFQGSADGGARNDSTKPGQLTRDDMKRMSPQEIDKAYEEGRFADLLKPT